MEMIINNLYLLLFFIGLVYIFYYLIRIIHLIISINNNQINQQNILEIKNDLFEKNKLIILWFSVSFFLFYIFY
jgi:hypothetical protein